jgi:hypothetical protein
MDLNQDEFSAAKQQQQPSCALGMHDDATFSEIKAAYHRLSKELSREEQHAQKRLDPTSRLLKEFFDDPDIRAEWSMDSAL